ncbi:MAG: hypothetical protein AAFQ19_02620 [Pseudomonadota bacterium]
MIRPLVLSLAATLGLAACAEVVSEREGVFVYRGDTLRAVTRTFSTGDGSFTKRYIYSRPRTVSCSATDDLDCVAAIRESRIDSNDGP